MKINFLLNIITLSKFDVSKSPFVIGMNGGFINCCNNAFQLTFFIQGCSLMDLAPISNINNKSI